MYSRSRLVCKYLRYYFTASNGRGHGVHSPFVYAFIKNILNDRRSYPAYDPVEKMRGRLSKDPTVLEIEDLGAGSVRGEASSVMGARLTPQAAPGKTTRFRSVAHLARHAAKPRRLGQLLFRIAQYYQPRTILELGTSLGLSTAYLAYGAPGAKVVTIEGAPAIAEEARKNFRGLALNNIEVITGNFDEWLPVALDGIENIGLCQGGGLQGGTGLPRGVELAFIDGNHRREPTLRYFNLLMERAVPPAVLIFDDIHWSGEMEQAWEDIKKDPRVMLTVDLFFIGLVFLRREYTVRQHFVIRY